MGSERHHSIDLFSLLWPNFLKLSCMNHVRYPPPFFKTFSNVSLVYNRKVWVPLLDWNRWDGVPTSDSRALARLFFHLMSTWCCWETTQTRRYHLKTPSTPCDFPLATFVNKMNSKLWLRKNAFFPLCFLLYQIILAHHTTSFPFRTTANKLKRCMYCCEIALVSAVKKFHLRVQW